MEDVYMCCRPNGSPAATSVTCWREVDVIGHHKAHVSKPFAQRDRVMSLSCVCAFNTICLLTKKQKRLLKRTKADQKSSDTKLIPLVQQKELCVLIFTTVFLHSRKDFQLTMRNCYAKLGDANDLFFFSIFKHKPSNWTVVYSSATSGFATVISGHTR